MLRRSVLKAAAGAAVISFAARPALAAPSLARLDVRFVVTGDKKKQTGINIVLYDSHNTVLARGSLPGSNNETDFWRQGETHYVSAYPVGSVSADSLSGARLHIDSGNPDEWHTLIEATAQFNDGSSREVLTQTGVIGFNYQGNNGQPSVDLTFP